MNARRALSDPMREFVDYFAELGPRWGFEPATCRVHAFLYLAGGAVDEREIGDALGMDAADVMARFSYGYSATSARESVSQTRSDLAIEPTLTYGFDALD